MELIDEISNWTTIELFDYLVDNDVLSENDTFEDWINDRPELLRMTKEHLLNS